MNRAAWWLFVLACGCAQGAEATGFGPDEDDASGEGVVHEAQGASGVGGSGGGGASASSTVTGGASSASSSASGSSAVASGASVASSAAATSGAGGASASSASSSVASTGAGGASGDPWFQIEYTSSSTPTSPSWAFSPTPGWTGADWAYQGEPWPEVWDVYQSIQVKFDPMGAYAAIIDPGDTLQVMLGFGKLQSYQDVVVQLEGRGYATSSSGVFDVYNPLNNCGKKGVTMAHDWTIHLVQVSLGGCIIPGNATQAVRVKPTQNGLALVRMKVTLVGAVY